jgi:hypothetical protein
VVKPLVADTARLTFALDDTPTERPRDAGVTQGDHEHVTVAGFTREYVPDPHPWRLVRAEVEPVTLGVGHGRTRAGNC